MPEPLNPVKTAEITTPAANHEARETPIVCHIFCRVIDNFGDMGVCWRLARQLREEHDLDVTLWLDDCSGLHALQPPELAARLDCNTAQGSVLLPGLRVCPWQQPFTVASALQPPNIVIEAFACELPAEYQTWLGQQSRAPLWINLEYLSAESWVGECHGLASVHPQTGMQKTFFFPGFTRVTGGLIREQDLLPRHQQWQSEERISRVAVLSALGVSDDDVEQLQAVRESLLVSVFTYETAALSAWLQLLAEGPVPVLCLIPLGRALHGLAFALTKAGDKLQLGNLTVQVVPFQCQDDYDRLLSVCDLNLVRGEDSFVRAQWAGKPMLWHIYRQQQGAHLQKLHAFVDLYTADMSDRQAQAVRAFWQDWNNGADCRASWPGFLALLPDFRHAARRWREKLLLPGDIASNLMKFYENRL